MYYISFSDSPLAALIVNTKYYDTPEEAENFLYREVPAMDSMWIMTSKIGSVFNEKIPSIISVYVDGDSSRWARIVKVSGKKKSVAEEKRDKKRNKKVETLPQHEQDVYFQSKMDKERADSGLLPKFLVVEMEQFSNTFDDNRYNTFDENTYRNYYEKNHLDKYVVIFRSSRTEMIGLGNVYGGYAESWVYRLMDKYEDFKAQEQ
jgi:hypothetical protein